VGLVAGGDGSGVDREGLRVVPEAAPNVAQDSTPPAGQGEVGAPGAQGAPAAPTGGDRGRVGGRKGTFRALRSRPFRLYFAGQVASASGTFVQQTAIAWLVLRITGSPAELGLVLAVGGVPSLLLGPWGGTVADRVSLRGLLIATQTTYGLLAGVLWVLAIAGPRRRLAASMSRVRGNRQSVSRAGPPGAWRQGGRAAGRWTGPPR
jgi:Transmembrane secretion effector